MKVGIHEKMLFFLGMTK